MIPACAKSMRARGGDGKADLQIALTGLITLLGSDFVL